MIEVNKRTYLRGDRELDSTKAYALRHGMEEYLVDSIKKTIIIFAKTALIIERIIHAEKWNSSHFTSFRLMGQVRVRIMS